MEGLFFLAYVAHFVLSTFYFKDYDSFYYFPGKMDESAQRGRLRKLPG